MEEQKTKKELLVELERKKWHQRMTPEPDIKNVAEAFFRHIRESKILFITFKNFKKEGNLKIVYIAGKVSGLPYADVADKFNTRKSILEKAGYTVINPCDNVPYDADWKTAMAICLALLPLADFINLLPDYMDSKGAMTEKALAEKLGIPRIEVKL